MRRKSKGKAGNCAGMEGDESHERVENNPSMAPALICAQPNGTAVVVAVGAGLRVSDCRGRQLSLTSDLAPARHANAIRSIAFDGRGELFASAGDDKVVMLWEASSWTCIRTLRAHKKVSALAFSMDSRFLCFADKFGSVYVTPTAASNRSAAGAAATAEDFTQLLAHCCSIICDLAFSPDGRLIASSDRDFKIRISVLPVNLMEGAHEIQSFCLGHTAFVSCIAFLADDDDDDSTTTAAKAEGSQGSSSLLVSGGGDGTVRLWVPETGELLDTFQMGGTTTTTTTQVAAADDAAEQSLLEEEGMSHEHEHEHEHAAVVALAVSKSIGHIAVCVERESTVAILTAARGSTEDSLHCRRRRRLLLLQRVALVGHAPPRSLCFMELPAGAWGCEDGESLEQGEQQQQQQQAMHKTSSSSKSGISSSTKRLFPLRGLCSYLWLASGAAQVLEGGDRILTPQEAAEIEARAASAASAAAVAIAAVSVRRVKLSAATTVTSSDHGGHAQAQAQAQAQALDHKCQNNNKEEIPTSEAVVGSDDSLPPGLKSHGPPGLTASETLTEMEGKNAGEKASCGISGRSVAQQQHKSKSSGSLQGFEYQLEVDEVMIPGGSALKQVLEGTSASDAARVVMAATKAEAATLKSQMLKKVYEEREGRKRTRNDKKVDACG